mmetsp:Transcript_19804/g.44731  ORF Transcript_19804/g.44731 Transcript_19804/m.44731 type:complete len:207 (-) Transcript_19804:615-1235(-)
MSNRCAHAGHLRLRFLMFTSTHCWQNMCRHLSSMTFFSRTLQTGHVTRDDRYFTCVCICSMVKEPSPPPCSVQPEADASLADSLASFLNTARDSIMDFLPCSLAFPSDTRSSHLFLATARSSDTEVNASLALASSHCIASFSARICWHSPCFCLTFSSSASFSFSNSSPTLSLALLASLAAIPSCSAALVFCRSMTFSFSSSFFFC